jgi:transcriptional regulator with XRE-family HTH domain
MSQPSLTSIVAENLAYRREHSDGGIGISQAQLAARAGLSSGMVSQIEQGRRTPSLETIERLAGAMGFRDRAWVLLVPRKRKGRKS